MKKNKVLKIVLIVLGALVILLAAAALGVLFYLRSMAAGIPETLPDASADSTELTLTDDDLDKLLSGDVTLGELTGETAASSGGEQEASASVLQEGEDSASASAGSAVSSASSPGQRAVQRLPPERRAAVPLPPASSRALLLRPAPVLLPLRKNRRPRPANRGPATRLRSRHC